MKKIDSEEIQCSDRGVKGTMWAQGHCPKLAVWAGKAPLSRGAGENCGRPIEGTQIEWSWSAKGMQVI
jgi:hypothetical protein